MSKIRVRTPYQITLPASIVRQARIEVGDTVQVGFVNGRIVLTPPQRGAPTVDLLSFAGAGRGFWGDSAAELDATLRETRDAWLR